MQSHWMRLLALICVAIPIAAQGDQPFDAAAAFGARPSVADLTLSPDGLRVAYVAPGPGQGSVVYTLELAKGAGPHAALGAAGKPDRLGGCEWVSNTRLVCIVHGVVNGPLLELRMVAVNADGSNLKLLSTKSNFYTRGLQLGGGNIIDWLPDQDGAALMSRVYLPDSRLSSRVGSSAEGVGVDWIDTQSASTKSIEPPRRDALA